MSSIPTSHKTPPKRHHKQHSALLNKENLSTKTIHLSTSRVVHQKNLFLSNIKPIDNFDKELLKGRLFKKIN